MGRSEPGDPTVPRLGELVEPLDDRLDEPPGERPIRVVERVASQAGEAVDEVVVGGPRSQADDLRKDLVDLVVPAGCHAPGEELLEVLARPGDSRETHEEPRGMSF